MSRGNEGLDFTPILTHYLFLFTTILAVLAWFIAFISQAIVTAQFASVGVAWFGIFLQLFLILGVIHTLASDSISMHRFQISVFGSIAIVFAVIAVNDSIFSGRPSLDAMAAGWLILAIVDILWVIFFTSEEHSLAWKILNSLGTGGLTPPSRRRTPVMSSNPNGHPARFSFDDPSRGSKVNVGQPITTPSEEAMQPPQHLRDSGPASVHETRDSVPQVTENPPLKAKALYAYTASPDDPNEISFAKEEILDITDSQGKWWQAKKADGTKGIAPSNYLQLI